MRVSMTQHTKNNSKLMPQIDLGGVIKWWMVWSSQAASDGGRKSQGVRQAESLSTPSPK